MLFFLPLLILFSVYCKCKQATICCCLYRLNALGLRPQQNKWIEDFKLLQDAEPSKGVNFAGTYPFTPHTWETLPEIDKLHFSDTLKFAFQDGRGKSGTIDDLENELVIWRKIYGMAAAVMCNIQDDIDQRELMALHLEDLTRTDDDDTEPGLGFEVNEKGGLEC